MYNIIFKPKHPPNFELLELKSVCRICLHCTNNLVSLFNNEIDSLISEFLPEKLNKKPLQPHQICKNCLEEAKIAYMFKKQCEYSDKLIKASLNEIDFNETFEKQTQTDFINFIHPCEKCEKFHATIFSCENCLEIFNCEDDLTNHNCPITFSCEKSAENDPLTEDQFFQLETDDFDKTEDFCEDEDEANFSECDLKSENSFNTDFSGDLGGKCNENILVNLNVEIIDEKDLNVKATKDIVKSMIKESEKKITKVKVTTTSNGRYECETCKKIFTRLIYYQRHQIVHSDCPKPYSCTLCSQSYSSASTLKIHVNGFHANIRPFKCLPCGKAYTTSAHLKRHILICPLLRNSGVDKKEPKRIAKDRIFSCQKCSRKYLTEKCLQDHIASQHDENREFICKYCKQKVIGANEYKKHCKEHNTFSGKEFLCSECGKSFGELRYLSKHMKIHRGKDGKKLYKCRYCDKSFSQSYLYMHQRLHTEGNIFQCTTCSKSFSSEYIMHNHMKIHTGERPYKCSNCPKSFVRADSLRSHMRMHTGERPYKCSYCPKTFSQACDLIVHHRRHTGERFYCNVCGDGFIQMYLLKRHKEKVHGINEPDRLSLLKNQKEKIMED